MVGLVPHFTLAWGSHGNLLMHYTLFTTTLEIEMGSRLPSLRRGGRGESVTITPTSLTTGRHSGGKYRTGGRRQLMGRTMHTYQCPQP